MPAPDIYSLLMGAGPDAAESAAALAEQIRRGRKAALAGALGSPGAIGGMGKIAYENAKQDQGILEKAGEQRLRYGEEAKAREATLKLSMQERDAALKQTLAIIAANKPQFHETPGTTVAGYELDPKTGHYVPVGTRDPNAGGRGGGGKNEKTYSKGEIDLLEKGNEMLVSVSRLHDNFQPQFAGKGVGGDWGLALDQWRGAGASPKDQVRANYWKELQMLITNPTRHSLFGSALSAHEKAAWDAADRLTVKSDPKVVKQTLATLRDVINKRLSNHARGRVAERFSPEATARYLSDTDYAKEYFAGGGAAAPSGGNPADAAALDWANKNPDDPRAKAIKQRLGVQ